MANKENQKNAKEQLELMLNNYLATNPLMRSDGKISEIELRFGSNRKFNTISKIDYDNVAQTLYNNGFKPENPNGFYSLRISHEYYNAKEKRAKMSNIRTEIVGIDLIQEYCKTNSIQKILDMPSSSFEKIKFTQKTRARNDDKDIEAADFKEFNMRISYQLEQTYTARAPIIRNFIDDWADKKKTFRLLNRVRFVHETLPIYADLSIVKWGKTTNNVQMKVWSIQDADVFNSPETYEIEMELDNSQMGGPGSKYKDTKSITDVLRKSMRIVFSGLQQSNYPISYTEQNNIKQEYMELLFGKQDNVVKINSGHFIGYQTFALELKHILETSDNMKHPNVRTNYTVTDKADGDRNLLFINKEGKIYLISSNMTVVFTGSQTNNKGAFETLIDGELIKYDKKGKFINLFAAFDIYFIKNKNIRDLPFCLYDGAEKSEKKIEYRLQLLQSVIKELKLVNILNSESPCEFNVSCKTFYETNANVSIFEGCSNIMSKIDDDIYEYNTDGLIFTPSDKAVCGEGSVAGPLKKTSWIHSFKWKPLEFLTIDFLVSVKKDKTGKDEIHNIFEDGIDTSKNTNIVQYKTLVLRCGFDEKKHGFLNPFNDVIDDKDTKFSNDENEETYKPVPFQPTNPYCPNACYAKILLSQNGEQMCMFTEENQYFEENMIVEFKYDMTKQEGWKWVPLRVRYDKTAQLNRNEKQYGNSYLVANNNWQCIHNPVTKEMITTGVNIPQYIEENEEEENVDMNEGVYYNKNNIDNKRSKSMRDFHNLYIKSKIIGSIANKDDTLIDYGVGKGGDLHKWIKSQLSFVLGIDKSKDCINNRLNGACVRYLKEKRNKKKIFSGLFLNGSSAENIRNGSAFKEPHGTQKEREISNAIFGNGPKDETVLGKAVYKNYGVGADGFNISSCQFTLHYFFENEIILNNFIRNLSECTRLNGYFVGCCFDGEKVFKLLSNKNKDESIILNDGENKMFEIKKKYNETGFPYDENSLGYCINVFQDSIGNTFCEYLVNFEYFKRIMENYGFVLIDNDEAKNFGLPNGSGLFEEMYNLMQDDIKKNPRVKATYRSAPLMTANEKTVSFLNRYFVFRKVRNIDAESMMKKILSKDLDDIPLVTKNNQEDEEDEVETTKTKAKVTIRKKKAVQTNEKIVIKKKK
jgi:hypothetical protein